MTTFFITLGLTLVVTFLASFFIGRKTALKYYKQFTANENDTKAKSTLARLSERDDNAGMFLGLALYALLIVGLIFATSFSSYRDELARKYDNGDYVWVQSERQYTTKDSLKFRQQVETYLITRKVFDRRVKNGDAKPQD